MRPRTGWATVIAVLGLAIALVLIEVSSAGAANGDPVRLGFFNQAESNTVVTADCTTNCMNTKTAGLVVTHAPDQNDVYPIGVLVQVGDPGIPGVSPDLAVGVRANSAGDGVLGLGAINGVVGYGSNGVVGYGSNGIEAHGTENGVLANGGTFGIFAEGTDYGTYSRGPNYGVFGQASTSTGVGVAASATGSGRALSVTGKAEFSRSGKATVLAGQSSITVSNVALSAKSLILATAQKSVAGVSVQAAVPNVAAKTITIYLNTSVGANYPVAWFIVERP